MNISILREAGFTEAMLGLSLSYGTSIDKANEVARTLAHKDGGHNKFLESIYIWFDVTAPRYWWQEADTYRLSTKQSESTMHTYGRREVTNDDFEDWLPQEQLNSINHTIRTYQEVKGDPLMDAIYFMRLKNDLPEGFLQRRVWVMNYKTLRNIILQRRTHRLPQWKQFCAFSVESVLHPWLLPTLDPLHQDTSQVSQADE